MAQVVETDRRRAGAAEERRELEGRHVAAPDPVEPRLEELGIPQGADLAPGGQQRGLDGIVSKVEVAQDPERDGHASVAGQASQGVEGLSIALLRLVN